MNAQQIIESLESLSTEDLHQVQKMTNHILVQRFDDKLAELREKTDKLMPEMDKMDNQINDLFNYFSDTFKPQ